MTETVLPKRAEKTSEAITDSYAVSDQYELVEELSKGRWVVYAHEWLPIEADLDDWKQSTAEACRDAGLTTELATYDASAATIVMNTAAMPSLEQIQASIASIEQYRLSATPPE